MGMTPESIRALVQKIRLHNWGANVEDYAFPSEIADVLEGLSNLLVHEAMGWEYRSRMASGQIFGTYADVSEWYGRETIERRRAAGPWVPVPAARSLDNTGDVYADSETVMRAASRIAEENADLLDRLADGKESDDD